jgi:hypothetical protein
MILKNEKCNEIEQGSPDNRLARRKHFCGNHSSNRVCRIVKAIDKIKDEGQRDDYDEKSHKSLFVDGSWLIVRDDGKGHEL